MGTGFLVFVSRGTCEFPGRNFLIGDFFHKGSPLQHKSDTVLNLQHVGRTQKKATCKWSYRYRDPKSIQQISSKAIIMAIKAIILHTFGVRVNSSRYPLKCFISRAKHRTFPPCPLIPRINGMHTYAVVRLRVLGLGSKKNVFTDFRVGTLVSSSQPHIYPCDSEESSMLKSADVLPARTQNSKVP